VLDADKLAAVVHADNPVWLAFKLGHTPYHTRCGEPCDFFTEPRPAGNVYMGVSCPRCLRPLMEGEVFYAASK
jgi:hypothetical protein